MKLLLLIFYTLLVNLTFGGECKLAGWCKLLEKADPKFVHKLHLRIDAIDKPDVNGNSILRQAQRYSGVDPDLKVAWAHQDYKKAYCEVGSVDGNNVGTVSADSFVDTLTHPKNIDAFDVKTGKMVPCEKMGSGLGHVSKHIDDAKCKKMLDGWRSNLDTVNPDPLKAAENFLQKKGYTSAHALRDCDDVFGLDLPGSDRLAVILSNNGSWGPTYQLNATASIHKRGETLVALEVDVDNTSSFSDLKGVDALTDSKAYNIKSTMKALEDTFFNPDGTINADAVTKITDAYKAAKVRIPSIKYVMVTPETPDLKTGSFPALKKNFTDPPPNGKGFSQEEFIELFETIAVRP
jgi:hypothetical protein